MRADLMAIRAQVIGGAGFWSSVATQTDIYTDGELRYVVLNDTARMGIVRRTRTEAFTDTIARVGPAQSFAVVINGNMYNYAPNRAGLLWGPGNPADTTPIGLVVESGVRTVGTTQPERFFIADTLGPVFGKDFGMGDPSTTSNLSAMGGLGPLVIGGLRYGTGNRYRAGTTGPAIGAPGAAAGDLIQRSNATYASAASRGAGTGKVAVGHSSVERKLIVVAQPDGGTGMSQDVFRDKLIGVGIDNAVFLDGSDSVTFWAGGSFHVQPGRMKNHSITIGLGFRILP
jgi:hypothetical protein